MIIKVLERHILEGSPCEQGHCPIALAMRDAGITSPHVASLYVLYVSNGVARSSSLPKEARDFVRNVDVGNAVEPFEFELSGI
jgi:hypothetical protein